jgi:hypothetical protein
MKSLEGHNDYKNAISKFINNGLKKLQKFNSDKLLIGVLAFGLLGLLVNRSLTIVKVV